MFETIGSILETLGGKVIVGLLAFVVMCALIGVHVHMPNLAQLIGGVKWAQ